MYKIETKGKVIIGGHLIAYGGSQKMISVIEVLDSDTIIRSSEQSNGTKYRALENTVKRYGIKVIELINQLKNDKLITISSTKEHLC